MKYLSTAPSSLRRLTNRLNWFHILIISGLFIFSVSLSIIPSDRTLLIILGVICGIGGAVIILRSPLIGLAILLIGSLIIPFSIGTGTQTGLNLTVLLLAALIGLWILGIITQKSSVKIISSRIELALTAFVLVAVLAFIVGQIPWLPTPNVPIRTQLGGLAVFVLSIGAFFLVSHQIHEERHLEWLVWIFLTLGAFYISGRIIPSIGQITQILVHPGATGSMLWVWLLAFASSQFLFNRKLALRWRILLAILILGILYVSLIKGATWTSGWLPPLIALATVLLMGTPRLGILATIFLVVVLTINKEWIIEYVMTGDNTYSLVTRQDAWRIILNLLKANPILGFGPANYYSHTAMYPIRGWYTHFSSHNNYIDILAQTGVLGLACFLWFVYEIGKLLLRLRFQIPEGFGRAYVYGAFGGLAGTLFAGMLGDWFLPFAYNVGLAGMRSSILPWFFLGGVLAISRFSHVVDEKQEMSKR